MFFEFYDGQWVEREMIRFGNLLESGIHVNQQEDRILMMILEACE